MTTEKTNEVPAGRAAVRSTRLLAAWLDKHSVTKEGSAKVAAKWKMKWKRTPTENGFYYLRHRTTGRILKTQVCWAPGNLWAHPEWPGDMAKTLKELKDYDCSGPMPYFG